MTGLANAQGLIKIYNAATFYTISTNGGPTGPSIGRTPNGAGGINLYYYTLLVGTSSTSLTPETWGSGQTLTATNYTIVAGGIIGPGGSSGFAADNWAYGTSQYVQLVGWSANLGSIWSHVDNEFTTGIFDPAVINDGGFYYGHSNIGLVTSSASGTLPPPTIFSAGGISSGWDLYYVPEPSTITLSALGGLSLLFFRRRK